MRPILKGVSFFAKPGQLIVIAGPSGSGKSTLGKLLVGAWPLTNGSIRLDGVEISQWPNGELVPYVGYVAQDAQIIEGTVAENVARFGAVDEKEVLLALQAVGLQKWLGKLDAGINTTLGNGSVLSGGEKQRLMLARAMYKSPHLLVMDEPNSHLDKNSEKYFKSWLFCNCYRNWFNTLS